MLRNTTPQGLGRALAGLRLEPPHRRGKWLVCPTGDSAAIVFHFGMTGSLVWSGEEPREHVHDRVVLELDGGEFRFRDMRKLQGIWLARDEREARALLGRVGPDALDVSGEQFVELLGARRGAVKAVLIDQRG